MTMSICDMIISKETGYLVLTKLFESYKTLSVRLMSGRIRLCYTQTVNVNYILPCSFRMMDGKVKCLKNVQPLDLIQFEHDHNLYN